MTAIPAATPLTTEGVDLTTLATAAAATMELGNNGRQILAVRNGSGNPLTVGIVTQETIPDGESTPLAVADRSVVIADGEIQLIGPFPTKIYNDGSSLVNFTFNELTSVTVQAFSF